jgi:mannosyltransferase
VPIHATQRGPFSMPGGSDWAQVASFIAGHAHPGDAIVFTEGGSPSLNPRSALHLYPRAFQGLEDVTLVTPYDRTVGLWDVTEPVARAAGRLAHSDGRVWLVVHWYRSSRTQPAQLTQLKALGFSVRDHTRENNDVIYFLTRHPS